MKAVCWAAMLLAAVLLIPFALSNREHVSLGLWPLPFLVDLPLYLLVLLLFQAMPSRRRDYAIAEAVRFGRVPFGRAAGRDFKEEG